MAYILPRMAVLFDCGGIFGHAYLPRESRVYGPNRSDQEASLETSVQKRDADNLAAYVLDTGPNRDRGFRFGSTQSNPEKCQAAQRACGC